MGCLKLKYHTVEALEPKAKNFLHIVGKEKYSPKNRVNFYPYGSIMPGRNSALHANTPSYQGQLKDAETNWSAFKLRMYDGRLAHWHSADPFAQHWSPYTAMGNNPIRRIDPDGGVDFYVDGIKMNSGQAAMFKDIAEDVALDGWYKELETGEVKWTDAKTEEEFKESEDKDKGEWLGKEFLDIKIKQKISTFYQEDGTVQDLALLPLLEITGDVSEHLKKNGAETMADILNDPTISPERKVELFNLYVQTSGDRYRDHPMGAAHMGLMELAITGPVAAVEGLGVAAKALANRTTIQTALQAQRIALPKAAKYVAKLMSKFSKGRTTEIVKSSKVAVNSTRQLQSKFKHATDFGVSGGTPTKANLAKYSSAINQHMNNPAVKVIQGTYKRNPAIHYVNPNNGLNVILKPNGSFVSGWKLNPAQLRNVLNRGSL